MTRIKFALICFPIVIANIVLYRMFLKIDGLFLFMGKPFGVMIGIFFITLRSRWNFCERKMTVPNAWIIFQMIFLFNMLNHPIFAIISILLICCMYIYGFFLEEKK